MKAHKIPNITFYKHSKETKPNAHETSFKTSFSIGDASQKIYTE